MIIFSTCTLFCSRFCLLNVLFSRCTVSAYFYCNYGERKECRFIVYILIYIASHSSLPFILCFTSIGTSIENDLIQKVGGFLKCCYHYGFTSKLLIVHHC